MDIVEKGINEITPYERNPRRNEEAVEYVKNSIREFGWKQPIVVDINNVIVVGHTRWLAAKELGLKKAPCLIASDLSDEQIKAYRLADNKTAEFASWDFELMDSEIDDIIDIDMTEFGFDLSEEIQKEVIEDTVPEQVESRAKVGDLWQLGEHRLICGDSTDVNVIDALMDGQKADMVFTDPPYGVSYTGGMQIKDGRIQSNQRDAIINDSLGYDELYEFLYDAFVNIGIHTNDKSAIYVFYAHSRSREFLNAFSDAGLKRRSIIVWHKVGGGFGDFMAQYMNAYEPCIYGSNGESVNWYGASNEKTVWDIEKESNCNLHPTMKPIAVCSRAIINSSNSQDCVLDLFGGSGSTLIACEQLNRKCFMCELDPHYCDVIIQRWENLTGNKAELL